MPSTKIIVFCLLALVVGEVYPRTVIWFMSPKKDVNRFDWDRVGAERCVLTWERG